MDCGNVDGKDDYEQSLPSQTDDTTFGAGTFSWQDPVHSWKAGPGEVMTVENLFRVTFQHFSLVTLAIPVISKYISKYVSLIWNFVQ